MAVDTEDPITGAPIFYDGGAPDTGVDPTAVAAYAADVGNRIVRADLAALEAYEFKRDGLTGHAGDTGIRYVYIDGTGWVVDLSMPYGVNWRTGGQSMADGSPSKQLTYDGTPVLRGGVEYASNGLTVPLSGIYEINVVANYDVSNTGRRDAAFAVNGTIQETYRYIGVASGAVPFLAATRAEVMLSAGDTITAWGQQTSGGTRQVTGFMSVKMVSS